MSLVKHESTNTMKLGQCHPLVLGPILMILVDQLCTTMLGQETEKAVVKMKRGLKGKITEIGVHSQTNSKSYLRQSIIAS